MARERGPALISLALLSGYVAVVSIWTPGGAALPLCPFHALTGLYCPGCGMTRMLYHLVHGHIELAFAQNPLAFAALPFVIGWMVQSLPLQRWPRGNISPRWSYALIAIIVIFTVLRNIPTWPTCTLAPGGC